MAIYRIEEIHPDSAWYAEKGSCVCIVGAVISTTKYSIIDASAKLGYKDILNMVVLNSPTDYPQQVHEISCIAGVKLKLLFGRRGYK